VAMFFAKTIFPLWRSLPFLLFYHFPLPVTVSGVFCTTKVESVVFSCSVRLSDCINNFGHYLV
jgi:hypothetical protein